MLQKFTLGIGESKTHVQGGKIYQISCSTFKNHDHKNKPLYHYHDEIRDDEIISTVEGNDNPPYDSPYSSSVTGEQIVFRENIIIRFTKNDDVSLNVEIEEK